MMIAVPLLLFWLFLGLDVRRTAGAIRPDANNEYNPLVRLLVRRFPGSYEWFNILYAVAAAFVILSLPYQWGLFLAYALFVGHLIGYGSWTRFNKYRGGAVRDQNLAFGINILGAILGGFVLSQFHRDLFL